MTVSRPYRFPVKSIILDTVNKCTTQMIVVP